MLFVASAPNLQCQSAGLSLKKCVTSGPTHIHKFSGITTKFSKVLKCSARF